MLKINIVLFLFISFIFNVFDCSRAIAQVSVWQESRRGSLYLDIGFNTPFVRSTTIHVDQPALSSSYDLTSFTGKSYSNISTAYLRFNYSIGYFFSYNQRWALELCYDPSNFQVSDNQEVQLKGKYKNVSNITKTVNFSTGHGFYFYNDGSGLVQLNLARRFPVFRDKIHNRSVDVRAAFGVGPVLLNTHNSFDSNANTPKFESSGGWNADIYLGLRGTYKRHYYADISYKYDYANINNINVYKGTASQILTSNSIIILLGYTFSTTRHNPLFREGERRRRDLPNGPEPRGDIPQAPPPPPAQ